MRVYCIRERELQMVLSEQCALLPCLTWNLLLFLVHSCSQPTLLLFKVYFFLLLLRPCMHSLTNQSTINHVLKKKKGLRRRRRGWHRADRVPGGVAEHGPKLRRARAVLRLRRLLPRILRQGRKDIGVCDGVLV